MQIHLISYHRPTDTYEFKAYDDGFDTHTATIIVTHRDDQTDITVEINPACGIPNTMHERVEWLCLHADDLHRAIKNALED